MSFPGANMTPPPMMWQVDNSHTYRDDILDGNGMKGCWVPVDCACPAGTKCKCAHAGQPKAPTAPSAPPPPG